LIKLYQKHRSNKKALIECGRCLSLWPYLTLPYLWGGQVVTPAQRWGHISSAQCAIPM